MALVNATMAWLKENVKDQVDFVLWTGDTARHDSDEKHPRSSSQVMNMNRRVADLFAESFSDNGRLEIPIVPTFGNNDFLPHNIFYPGPNKWLHAYSDIWKRFIPEEQHHSFEFGGWFEVEVIPNRLSVFSLNTMYFFDRNAGVDGCMEPSEPGFKHMEWLSIQLQRLRERNMKAILIGHVPPARTDSKQLWDETCWQKYTLWLKQYRDVVTGSLYGHMNMDHFLLQDTKDIDITVADADRWARDPLDNEVSIASKESYLRDLRDAWSDLPSSAIETLGEDDDEDDQADKLKGEGRKKKKGKKYKKIGGKYAERYQLSLISPSIVPNYFPTIRIIEYDITGLENAQVWTDTFDVENTTPSSATPQIWDEEWDEEDVRLELKRDLETERKKHKKKKGKKGKKGKGGKGKQPHDPNLVIPEDPPKGSLPGPAYLRQPFTFTGYTQYFANLTHINNDVKDSSQLDESRWREGVHKDKDPKRDNAHPRPFAFEVEYSTFTDKIFKLPDLTVRSYVKLAYRIAKRGKKKKKSNGKGNALEWDDDFEEEEWDDDDDDIDNDIEMDSEDDVEVDDDTEVEKTGKGKKKGKKRKANKVWLHFLSEAFVNTVPKKVLRKW